VGGCGAGEERRGGGGGDGWIVGVMGIGRGNGEMEEKGGWGLVGKGERQREGTLEANDFITRFLGYISALIYELSTIERGGIHTYSRYSPPKKREKILQIPWFGRIFVKSISFVSVLSM